MPAIGGITAIIGIAPRTALVRTAMSVRLKKELRSTEPGNETRKQGDFSAAVGQMIHACDVQVHELRNMPLDGGFQAFVDQPLSTAGALADQGPSSKVETTSLSRKRI